MLTLIFIFFASTSFIFLPAWVYPQVPFYQGKTITIVQGREPGGSGDMRVKAVIPYLRKYVPGNPTVVSEYMTGGGGRKAVNHVYRVTRPDGLTIGNVGGGMVSAAILGEVGVQYDLDKLIYLGSPNSASHYVFMTGKEIGLSSLEKLQQSTGLRIGAQSVGHDNYIVGRLFAYLYGLKEPKFVTGYSGPEVDIALLRGEVDARGNSVDTVLHRNPEWLEKRIVDFQGIIEIPKGDKHPRFPHLLELETFAKAEKENKILALFRAFRLAGSPYILPPGTPRERVNILQEAMRKTFKDPEFYKEYKKLAGGDPSPLMPEGHEKTIRELPRDREVIELFKKVAGADPLPPR